MNEQERKAVTQLIHISVLHEEKAKDKYIKREFMCDFGTDIKFNPQYLISLLERAYVEKNADDVELCLIVTSVFDLFSLSFVDVLCKLIVEDWHYCHENIAFTLQDLKSPDSIESLYKAALSEHEYLEPNKEANPLAVKCIWALGEINTPESREKLKLLATSENEVIKDNALHQLSRY